MLEKITHPTTDPNLPSFLHDELGSVLGDLSVVDDCWNLLKGRKETHLPKEQGEPDKAYEARVMRSSYPSFFRDAVISYAGSLSRFDDNILPASMAAARGNIDRQGTSLIGKLMQADALMLRHAACLMMVDAPPDRPAHRGVQLATDHRPYLTIHERAAVRNWRTLNVNGTEVVQQLTLLELQERPDGLYGTTLAPVYKVMAGGSWATYELREKDSGGGGWDVVEIGAGEFTDASGNLMEAPPVYWYAAQGKGFGAGSLPLGSLANLTLDHFREYSDSKELLHLTALPTPVREGALGTGPVSPDGAPTTPPLILGPHYGVDVPIGGGLSFAEVAGTSLDRHQTHMEHIEKLIDRQTLSFLFSGGGETATQALLETAQLQATLASVGESKVSMVRALVEIWCQFTGETPDPDAGISMRSGVFDKPLGTDELRLVRDLYNDQLISQKSAVWLINKAGLLPPEISPDDEVKRIVDEEPEPADAPGVNDLADADLGENGLPVTEGLAVRGRGRQRVAAEA